MAQFMQALFGGNRRNGEETQDNVRSPDTETNKRIVYILRCLLSGTVLSGFSLQDIKIFILHVSQQGLQGAANIAKNLMDSVTAVSLEYVEEAKALNVANDLETESVVDDRKRKQSEDGGSARKRKPASTSVSSFPAFLPEAIYTFPQLAKFVAVHLNRATSSVSF